jgi:indolepyruvate ferredoxin oxidoreductase alpha subunit
MKDPVPGAYALARGAIEAGVSLVTGYPGAPTTAVVNKILALTSPDEVQVEWTSNEKVAIEMAFGASLGGMRSFLCVKSVGLNVALDPLMALNLSGCNAGLVLLVGDDPGGWGSQNEQDSRTLALAAEIPLLEPTSVSDARAAVRQAFQLSEETGLPIIVRVTRALVLAQEVELAEEEIQAALPPSFQREFMRWVVLPINVVARHLDLLQRLDAVQARFEDSPFNGVEGYGSRGVIAAGFAYQKLLNLLGGTVPPGLRVLRLGTFHPLPVERVTAFLQTVGSALILEETAPLVERAVRAAAQGLVLSEVEGAGLSLPVYGRDTGHVSRVGELFAPQIVAALNRFMPRLALPTEGESSRPMPSRESLCDGCPYIPIFDALTEVIAQLGGRDEVIVVGDPGCMVRAQLPPYELLDVKISLGSSIGMSLGSSIGMAAGIALDQRRLDPVAGSHPEPVEGSKRGKGRQVVALCGDSSFLHSGFSGLVDATRVGARMLVLMLDNGTTALSGGQPHPASRTDARGRPRRAVDLAALAREAGADMVQVVDLDHGGDIRAAIEMGMDFDGVAVVIARGQCPRWSAAR